MSYSFVSPCWACEKNVDNKGACDDKKKIEAAITAIHQTTYEQGHQGGGEIVLMCVRQKTTQP